MWKRPDFALSRLGACTIGILVSMAGCASPPALSPWPDPRPLAREISAAHANQAVADSDSAHPARAPEPKGELTLQEALSLALENNPRLEAFSWTVRAAEARALQAGLLPNPEFDLEGENVAGTGELRGFDAAETTLQLAQLIETGAKRVKRRRVATLDARLSGWDYEAARIGVADDVTRAFVAVLAAQERLQLSEELLRAAQEALTSVQARVREGAASPVERARAQVVEAASRAERDRRQAELEIARMQLAALWGSTRPTFASVVGDLFTFPAPPTLGYLLERIHQNPDLARWTEEVTRREAEIELQDARRIPDVTFGVGYRNLSETNDRALVFGVSVPLPLFDRNQGERAAARYELARARADRRASEASTRAALGAAYQELRAAYQRTRTFQDDLLGNAEVAYQETLQGYRRGLFRYIDVIDAQRTLFELRTAYIEALESYHAAVSKLERLTGEAL